MCLRDLEGPTGRAGRNPSNPPDPEDWSLGLGLRVTHWSLTGLYSGQSLAGYLPYIHMDTDVCTVTHSLHAYTQIYVCTCNNAHPQWSRAYSFTCLCVQTTPFLLSSLAGFQLLRVRTGQRVGNPSTSCVYASVLSNPTCCKLQVSA